ncbi:MAG: tandem-95 repeat protein, partial [Gammaproteobacteria bacterium]|nr:tandem-95 repeat protein [Gammaproteobacteria bacterium]
MTTALRGSLTLCVLAAGLALSACQSDQAAAPPAAQLGGRFVDDPVAGLGYATATLSGVTGTQGEFAYREGEVVRFRLGRIELGEAPGAAVLTPADLVDAVGQVPAKAGTISDNALNLARLLQTLDADCTLANGIQISETARSVAADASLDLFQPVAEFERSEAVEAFIAAAAPDCAGDALIAAQTARDNLLDTLDYIASHGGAANRLPAAEAGPALTADEGERVMLAGSGADEDGSIVGYRWRQTGGPAVTLSGANTATPEFRAPAVDGAPSVELRFALVVLDNDGGASAADEVVVAVNDRVAGNVEPTARIAVSPGLTVAARSPVTLDGSASSDADGRIVAYTWRQLGGPTVALATPDADKSGFTAPAVPASTTLKFELRVVDDDGASGTQQVEVVVAPVNDAPTVSDIGDATTLEDTPTAAIEFTFDDVDGGIDALAIGVASDNPGLIPAGAATITRGGNQARLILTPAANRSGSATITVTVSDGAASASDTFVLTVQPVNDAPVAQAASVDASEDTALSGQLAAGDVDSASLSFVRVGDAAHGSVIVNDDGSFIYTPAVDFNGTDSFTFKASDGALESAPATVTVTVAAVNDAPVAQAASASGTEDSALSGRLAAGDVDSANLSFVRVDGPAHGAVTVAADGAFTYTPAANFAGSDSFTFKANDGTADSAPATISIAIAAVNDAPVAQAASLDAREDTALDGQLAASDVDSAELTYALAAAPANGSVTVDTDGGFRYTPAADFNGADSFTFKANDGQLDSNAATVTIAVAGANDAPVALPQSLTTDEDRAAAGTLAATDADGDALTFAVVGQPGHGTVTVAADGAFTYTPAANFAGSDSFTFKANDGTADSAPATISIAIAAVNDAPVAADDNAEIDEDGSAQLAVLANDGDADGDALTIIEWSAPSQGGTVDPMGGEFRYAPRPDFHGTETFRYTVTDGKGLTASATVTITVRSVNDLPVANADYGSMDEDGDSLLLTVLDNDTDADAGDTPTVIEVGTPNQGGSAAIALDGTAIAYTPAPDFNGTETFTYTVGDGNGGTASAAVTVTVAAVNDAPVATSTTFNVNEDPAAPLSEQLAATDVDGDATSFRLDTAPTSGTASVAADGGFSYRPAVNFAGTDSFTFVARDGTADSAPATVRVTVSDQPEATLGIADVAVEEGTGAPVRELVFTLTLSRAPDSAVTVSYETADGSATAPADYASAGGTATIGTGATSQTIRVPVMADNAEENDETLSLNLAVTAGADSVQNGGDEFVALGTIANDDFKNLLLIGAAKRSLTPTQAQIDGIEEPRAFGGGTHLQKFNLGGFGINVGQNLPDPAGEIPAQATTTEPAGRRVYQNSLGRDEHTNVRVFAIEQRGGTVVVFVMIDAIGAGNIIQQGVKDAIMAAAADLGVAVLPENILFGQTHSHTAADLQGLWGGVPQDWIENVLYVQAAAAATEALGTRRPAHLRLRQGYTVDFNNYRRPRIDANADADGTITLLSATGDDGTPVGNILQYNAHPTSIGDGTKPRTPHSEYILGAMDWLESLGGGTALYFNGPIADASPSGSRAGCAPLAADQPFSGVRCRGEGMADHLLNPANVLADRELAASVTAQSVTAYLPITNPAFVAAAGAGSFNRYYNFTELPVDQIPGIGPQAAADLPQIAPVAITTVSRVTLGGEGGLEVVTIPGETTNTFGNYIRSLAGTNVMLLGLTHNSFGYILPEEEFSYLAQDGDDGFVAPFTGYEENVSLGPLTAPLLRTQAYNMLFAADPQAYVPPTLASCAQEANSPTCLLQVAENRANILQDDLRVCMESGLGADGCPFRKAIGYFTDGLGTFADGCRDFGGPEEFCSVFDQLAAALSGTGTGPSADDELLPLVADAQLRGCDFLDPAHCLFPFPNDHFTVAAAAGSPQAQNAANPELGGTGRRVNFNPLAMPRNTAGKPVDPTEWNRNDGFSPGQMIVTYVPGLAANADGTIPGAAPITDVARSLDADAPIFVIDADTGERHLVWAEIDLNANLLLWQSAPEVQPHGDQVERPTHDGRAALIVRPAQNFREGRRYIVALRNLRDAEGRQLTPSAGFRLCRGDIESPLSNAPAVAERCAHIRSLIDTLDSFESGFDEDELYLTWDFTVASARNDVGRLAHMRDDAFNSLATQPGTDCTQYVDGAPCAAPAFTIDHVAYAGDDGVEGGIARKIEGTIAVPSYVVPVEPTPADNEQAVAALRQFCGGVPQEDFNSGCKDVYDIAGGATLPPNRLFYSPADNPNPSDPQGQRYGDGLPDSVGTMQTRFMCQIPSKALSEGPSRAGIYGHGLLDSRVAITYDGVDDLSREHNFMFCAVDLFGFSTGDLVNVASTLVDLSNFPVVPDGSQQGLLNYMFLARLVAHPQGFAADAAFQGEVGKPLFARREVFYDGNSQGGIVGGAVMAISKDVNRGVLGSLGMNYSTLLQRSKDFDP